MYSCRFGLIKNYLSVFYSKYVIYHDTIIPGYFRVRHPGQGKIRAGLKNVYCVNADVL